MEVSGGHTLSDALEMSATSNWTSRAIEDVARRARQGASWAHRVREKKTRSVMRLQLASGDTLILKLWIIDGVPARVANRIRRAPVDREWVGLQRALSLGVPAPRPLGLVRVRWSDEQTGAAMIMSDLGGLPRATEYIKECLAAQDLGRLSRLEDDVVRMTQTMIEGGLLDEDHGTLNILVSGDGTPLRVDLERTCLGASRWLHPGVWARMLGRLIVTYGFAVSGDPEHVERFHAKLLSAMHPPAAIWCGALRSAAARIRRASENPQPRAILAGDRLREDTARRD